MRDGGRADAALGADHRDDAAGDDGFGRREQAADRTDHVDRFDRSHHIVVDAAAHQLAIGRGVVGIADHDHAGPGIADAGEIVQALEDVARAVGFDHDHVRRRHRLIDFDRRGEAAFLGGQVRLGQPAILSRRGYRGERLVGLAKGLHRDARNRRNVLLGVPRMVRFFVVDARHLPVSLSLALSASGLGVAIAAPLR
ncbi:hypothetical protein ACVIHC_005812 [Bradyrhizobium diazoefficiens]